MRLRNILLSAIAATITTIVTAHEPLYVVNGVAMKGIDHIPHENIESIDVLPADEQTIDEWGIEASEGVIMVQLRYDTPAQFVAESCDSFTSYLSQVVKWGENMDVARLSLRLNIDTEGRATISEVLQATSRQLLKRVERAIDEAPKWQAATRNGRSVESIVLINLQLPVGREMPVERGILLL